MCTGDEALQYLTSEAAADIMFMDIRMPGRTGVEVMQQAPRPAFPVVAMTAQVEEEMQVLFR